MTVTFRLGNYRLSAECHGQYAYYKRTSYCYDFFQQAYPSDLKLFVYSFDHPRRISDSNAVVGYILRHH